MFEYGFFGLFKGIEFCGGAIFALSLIILGIAAIYYLIKYSSKYPLIFLLLSLVYWGIVSVYITSILDDYVRINDGFDYNNWTISENENYRNINIDTIDVIKVDDYQEFFSCKLDYENIIPKEYKTNGKYVCITYDNHEQYLFTTQNNHTDYIGEIWYTDKASYWLGCGFVYLIYFVMWIITLIYKKKALK